MTTKLLANLGVHDYCFGMRTTNTRKLKELIKAHGENAKAHVSIGAKVSISALEKMMAGSYGSEPRAATRERLCRFFRVAEDDLFPPARGHKAS